MRHSQKIKDKRCTLFAYSYAARDILEFARAKGWSTILGQIDPGPQEEKIVLRLYDKNPSLRGKWHPAPPRYWEEWRQECQTADKIVVNSKWSRDALLLDGVPAEKVYIVPLAYEDKTARQTFVREYPTIFTTKRPMRVLFLGQIILRKGILPLLHAARLLRYEPIEFWLVGAVQISLPGDLQMAHNMFWFGTAERNNTGKYYRDADVFILPTYSDGFGLTQLEAQAWKLPVIASRFCGSVVHDRVNGILLDEVSGTAVASALLNLLTNPTELRAMSERSGIDNKFSLSSLASALLNL